MSARRANQLRASSRHGRDRRLPERRQVDARQPPHGEPPGGRPRDPGGDARPQGARLRVERRPLPPDRHGRRRRPRHRRLQPRDREAGAGGDPGGRPDPLRRRCAARDHAGRRGARGDAAGLEEAGLRAREQDRRPAQGLPGGRVPPARARRSVAALRAARPRHRRPARRGRREAPGRGTGAGRGGDDPRRDPRPAERRQVVAPERARRARAGDRLRRPRHDARRDRHDPRPRRAAVPARRHGGPAAQAQAAAGDRVLLGAAGARGRRASRRRADPDRRERGDRRAGPLRRGRRAQGGLLVARGALEVGRERGHARGREAEDRVAAAPAPPGDRGLGEDRPRDSTGCSTTSSRSSASTRAGFRRRR